MATLGCAASSRWPSAASRGVEGSLTRIGAYTYMMDATRKMTAGAVDLGKKPSVVSAIAKYHVTERARQVVNDGMDVVGKGICLGPSNFLGRAYQQVPIGITVEGANILTRSLIIFGQGAIRCHPYLLAEMQAAQSGYRPEPGRFRQGAVGHTAYTISHGVRALWLGLTGSHFVGVDADVALRNQTLLPATHTVFPRRFPSSPTFRFWFSAAASNGGKSSRPAWATSSPRCT